ncbi:hypothetical protein EJD97_023316 [Solanum chilense]|uniref:Uncharacterized protein n=1 Tax=Solanum chilense TaxID=4083 RepID=A0A6N2AS90_SOLCI|nr:hypothetical protein EJD97_023316 [Solanum chilense]
MVGALQLRCAKPCLTEAYFGHNAGAPCQTLGRTTGTPRQLARCDLGKDRPTCECKNFNNFLFISWNPQIIPFSIAPPTH